MIPRYARFLAKTYLYLFALLTVFRLIAAFLVARALDQVSWNNLSYAFFMGWRFDNVIMCAVLTLPFLFLTLNQYLFKSQRLQQISMWPLLFFVPVIVLLQIIDLIYFEHFSVRITSVLLNWVDDLGFTVKMVKDEPLWLLAVVFMPITMWGFTYPIRKWSAENFWHPLLGSKKYLWGLCSILLLGVFFLGIRGRVAIKSPIREGTAYFSTNPTLNHLALNPTYTFFASWARLRKYQEKPLRFMSPEKAIELIAKDYQYQPTAGLNPLTRKINAGALKDLNVVLVIMEGMSGYYTDYHRDPSWTPNLDRLKKEGWEFNRTFSAGTHTYNGVWSSLFSFPSPYTMHPLKRDIIPQLNSFAAQFTQKHRETYFYTTHDDQFDNMAGFVRQNGFDHIVHQADYPSERVFSILGVPDHDMFHHSLNTFEKADEKGRFFAALLTGSNHKPHVIPPELKTQFNSPNEKENIVRYSDWAIGDFLERASTKPWAKRTLFAFIADHGQTASTRSPLDQVLSYHHVPFIIWSPANLKPRKIESPAMQVDVIPTVLGRLGGEWYNSTLGRDVITHPRNWVYLGRDEVTCLLTATMLECETQDKSHNRMMNPAPYWPTKVEVPSADVWPIIHAELQLSDGVLRERQTFP